MVPQKQKRHSESRKSDLLYQRILLTNYFYQRLCQCGGRYDGRLGITVYERNSCGQILFL